MTEVAEPVKSARHGPTTVVVVGASVAGVRAARALRAEGFGGRVVVVGDEPEAPYDKPPLSKEYLAGSFDVERLGLLSEEQALASGVELRLGSAAVGLDVAGSSVALADGATLNYDVCVIATGACARPSPWSATAGVHLLRTRFDGDALRRDLAEGSTVAVVGGGFIGAEVASTATALGCAVTVIDPLAVPMSRLAGEEVGALLCAAHERHGVATRFGVGVTSMEGERGDLVLTLTDGSQLCADVAVVGIGAKPNDGWLASSGLLVDDGVVCDEQCRAVDAPAVYAAGDIARWRQRGELVRVEHWTNAVDQAACVAHNIAHPESLRVYDPVGYVWSDQYDLRIQVVGHPERAASHRVLGETTPPGRFAALFAHDDGRLAGAVVVNWPRALVEARRLAGADAGIDAATERINGLSSPARP